MLTGVERGERSDAVKVTAIFRQSVSEKVIIEGVRRRGQQVGGDEAGPALLDGPAIAFPGAAGQSRAVWMAESSALFFATHQSCTAAAWPLEAAVVDRKYTY